jgi:hypothetical protein
MNDTIAVELTQKLHSFSTKDSELLILDSVLATQLAHQLLRVALHAYFLGTDLQERFEPH